MLAASDCNEMKKLLCTFLTALSIAATPAAGAEELPPPEPASSEQFAPGQVWRYKTRPGEESSRAIIGKIEKSPIGTIVHVKLTGLRLKNPFAPGGLITVLPHAPVSEVALSASVTELTNEASDLDGFSEGYNIWLSAFRTGKAGVFTLTLSEIAGVIEQSFNQGGE